ncbi:MAG: hypothetical protein WAN92_05130 [Herbaspirillum sp.]
MGDHADISDASIEAAVARGIADVRSKASLQATGHCRFCDAEIGNILLFCDADCRDDYDREQAALKRAGHKGYSIL